MEERSTTRVRRRRRRGYYEGALEAPPLRRKRRAPLVLVALVVAAVWFAPVIVAKTPLAPSLLRWVFADVDVKARIERVSLGWFSPIVVEGLDLRDATGGPLFSVRRLTGEKRLFSWLLNRQDLGVIRFESAHGQVEFLDESTNFEAAFAAWLATEGPQRSLFEWLASAGLHSFEVEVADAALVCIDERTQRRCTFDRLNASAKFLSPSEGIRARLRAVCEQDQRRSAIDATCDLIPTEKDSSASQPSRILLESEALPIWLAGAALRRLVPGLEMDGQLASSIDGQWHSINGGPVQATLKADCVAKSLYCTAAALSGDQVRLTEVRLPLDVSWRDQQLQVAQARLDSEVGRVSFTGTLDPALGWIDSLRRKPYHLTGHVDLARLAGMLPHTIHVRDDTRITAGVVDLVLNADAKHEGLVWQGKLETSQLTALSGGQTFSWERPVLLTFEAHETPETLVVDRLQGDADFLELQGEGTATDGHLAATFDLDRLSRELSRFIDLGSLRMAGEGTAYVAWQRKAAGVFEANSQFDARKFELGYAGQDPWREAQLDVAAELLGQMEGSRLERIDRGQVRVTAGGDLLTAQLQQPVFQPLDGGLWSIAVALRGELARWTPRMRPWLGALAEYQVAGDCDLSADVVYGASQWELEPLAARIRGFRFVGSGLNVHENAVDLSASTRWSPNEQRVELSNVRWASAALVAEGKDLTIALDPEHAGALQGNVQYSGELGQLWSWTQDASSPSSWQLGGRLNGRLDVRRTSGIVQASLENTIDQFQARLEGEQAWKEPQLRWGSRLEHDPAKETLKLEDFHLSGQALQCTARGEIRELSTRRNLALDGRLRYDLARLQPLWQQWVGSGIRLEGIDERPFSIRGPLGTMGTSNNRGALEPLVAVQRGQTPVRHSTSGGAGSDEWLAQMEGNAEVHWTRGDLYGFGLGPGDLRARLLQGVLNIDPIEASASHGRIRLAPTIRMSPGPMELTLQPGRVAERILITPEMCDRALKFVAPVLAEVTQAQGQFSVDVDGCRLPLSAPSTGDLAGKLRVHSVEVGPGPLVQALAVLLTKAAPARITRESTVEFRMVNGRVYHKGLELAFPDFTMRTHGSVGLDESLAIMAEMPVPPKWIGNNRLGDALKNQTIQLPIGGTLRAPKIDERALQQTSARFVRDAAAGAVQKEIFRQLDRVLGPVTQ
jgi:hypothetical protein